MVKINEQIFDRNMNSLHCQKKQERPHNVKKYKLTKWQKGRALNTILLRAHKRQKV